MGKNVSNGFREQKEILARGVILEIQCHACLTEKFLRDFPSREKAPSRWNHYCLECLAEFLSEMVPTRPLENFACSECPGVWPQEFIRCYAPAEVHAQAEHRQLLNALENDPNFRRCQKCGEGQFCPYGEAEPIIRCVGCGHRSCFMHREDWVIDWGCRLCNDKNGRDRRRERLEQEQQNIQWYEVMVRRGLVKLCPNCEVPIEKNHGCDHMTCSNWNCRIHFCWTCGVTSRSSLLPHQVDCPRVTHL